MAQRAFDDLLGYVRQREQFGSPIGSFQALRHRIADLAIEIEASRALTYATVRQIEQGLGSAEARVRMTSMANVKVTETAKKVALEGVQMMGGYGGVTALMGLVPALAPAYGKYRSHLEALGRSTDPA